MHRLIKPLIKISLIRSFVAGSTVIYQGESPRNACIVSEGLIAVCNINSQGEKQIITFHRPGEFFPSSWIFGKAPASLYFYEAVTDSKVAFISREELLRYMLGDNERLHSVLDYFTTNYTAFMIRIGALEQAKAREKLTFTLYYLCQRYGRPRGKNIEIEIALTHQNIAGLVGLTRETTATEMGKLKKEKVLTYKHQKYIVDLDKLIDVIGEESFHNIDISQRT